jgi:hypothetical protein
VSRAAPWKALERRVAKALGGDRVWRQDFGEVAPDVVSSFEVVDCKCYQRHAAVELYVKNEKKYRVYARGRRFVLALFSRDHPRAGTFYLLAEADYLDLKRKAGEL